MLFCCLLTRFRVCGGGWIAIGVTFLGLSFRIRAILLCAGCIVISMPRLDIPSTSSLIFRFLFSEQPSAGYQLQPCLSSSSLI